MDKRKLFTRIIAALLLIFMLASVFGTLLMYLFAM